MQVARTKLRGVHDCEDSNIAKTPILRRLYFYLESYYTPRKLLPIRAHPEKMDPLRSAQQSLLDEDGHRRGSEVIQQSIVNIAQQSLEDGSLPRKGSASTTPVYRDLPQSGDAEARGHGVIIDNVERSNLPERASTAIVRCDLQQSGDVGTFQPDGPIDTVENTSPQSETVELQPDVSDSSDRMTAQNGTDEAEAEEDAYADRAPTWRPFWLRPAVLSTFAGLFFCGTVALSVMLWYSQQNDGLITTRRNLEYIWRFGPTASKDLPSWN